MASIDIPFHGTGTFTVAIDGTLHLEFEVPPLPERPPRPEPEPPVFVVGETYPDDDTVGTAVIGPPPFLLVSEDIHYTSPPDEPVTDTVFEGRVFVETDGMEFVNCSFRGPLIWTDDGWLVQIDPKRVTPAGRPVFRYCDFQPQTPTSYAGGIGWKLYQLEQCHLWETVDALSVFARSDDPDPAAHVTILGTWVERMAQFRPDVANNRDITHNDGMQLQGNVGPSDDALVDGSRIDAYPSPDVSTLPTEHRELAAFMLTPNQQDRVCLTVRRSWLGGGVFTLNGANSSNSRTVLVLEDNKWERPHSGGPSAAIALDPSLTNRTLTGNVYADNGEPVPVYDA